MKISELVKMLQGCDQDAEIWTINMSFRKDDKEGLTGISNDQSHYVSRYELPAYEPMVKDPHGFQHAGGNNFLK